MERLGRGGGAAEADADPAERGRLPRDRPRLRAGAGGGARAARRAAAAVPLRPDRAAASGEMVAKIIGVAAISTTVAGRQIIAASSRPPLSGRAISPVRPAPRQRAHIACTPDDMPIMNETATKLTKLLMPTAASAVVPSVPTMAVSTRLTMFCDAIAPMIG